MGIDIESGYANKHFQSKGKTKKGKKKGKWEEYKFLYISYYKIVDEEVVPKGEYVLTYGIGKYVNGEREGIWKLYLIDHITKKKYHCIDVNYKNGLWDGNTTFYYPDGSRSGTFIYIDDAAEGPCTVYYPNGAVERTYSYSKGYAQGDCKVYYRNGKIKLSFKYCEDKPCGHTIGYYESGEKKYEENFAEGLLQDTSTHWYRSGTVKKEMNNNKGKLHGIYKYYHENGELWVEREYDNGLIVNTINLNDSEGNPLDPGDLLNGNGNVNYYTEAGNVYMIHTYKNGEKVGEVTFDVE